MKNTILILILSSMSSGLLAESVKLTAWEEFEAQKSIILKDISDDIIYNEIAYADVKLVRDALDRMTLELEGVVNMEDLKQDSLVLLHNEQSLVNTILTMAENDSRRVCRRRGTLGTNFKTTTCETVKDRRERQQADRQAITDYLKSDIAPVIGPGAIGGNQ